MIKPKAQALVLWHAWQNKEALGARKVSQSLIIFCFVQEFNRYLISQGQFSQGTITGGNKKKHPQSHLAGDKEIGTDFCGGGGGARRLPLQLDADHSFSDAAAVWLLKHVDKDAFAELIFVEGNAEWWRDFSVFHCHSTCCWKATMAAQRGCPLKVAVPENESA